MKLLDLVKPLTDLARPFSIYSGAAGVFVGLFVPTVPADKLWVAAAMAGVVGVARSIDKHAEAKYGAGAQGGPNV